MGTKKKIIAIGKEAYALQKDFLDWNKRAANFFLHPHYKIDIEQNEILVYTHFTDNMRYSVSSMNNLMTLLIDNYSKIYNGYESQLNFLIAIVSFVLSIVGLGISLYPLFLTEDFNTVLNRSKVTQKIEVIEAKLDSISFQMITKFKADSIHNAVHLSKERKAPPLKKKK